MPASDLSRIPPLHLTDRYVRAVDYARVLHTSDVRKGTAIPYLSHLLGVSALVLEYGGDEDQAIAGLLHDSAEDHGGRARLDDVRVKFGDDVAEIVAACSDSLAADKQEKEPWWQRKVRYIDALEQEPDRAVLVSAADKLFNARAILRDYRTLGDELWSRFNVDAGRAGTLWYYNRLRRTLATRLEALGPLAAQLAADLEHTVGSLHTCCVDRVGADAIEQDARSAAEREANTRSDLTPSTSS
jgi:(p)ppGpp synthase/HD superfamily hydrolase